MTVHTAKGLEFPVVFLTGLEERIFPHARSVDDDSAVEEERRLCYVAVTRARTLLHLSRVRRRRLSGQELPGIPSRFLRDLPPKASSRSSRRVRPSTAATARAKGAAPGAGAGAATKRRRFATTSGRSSRTCRRARRASPAPGRRAAAPAPAVSPARLSVEYDTDDSAAGPGCRSAPSCATHPSASARCAPGKEPAPISR